MVVIFSQAEDHLLVSNKSPLQNIVEQWKHKLREVMRTASNSGMDKSNTDSDTFTPVPILTVCTLVPVTLSVFWGDDR